MEQSKVYIFGNISFGYARAFVKDEKLSDFIETNIGKPLKNEWETPNIHWYEEDGDIIADFPFMLGYIPLCSENAYRVISDLIPKSDVEFLPVIIENKSYYIINPLCKEKGLLNIKKSKIKYFSNGNISWISDYVFFHDNVSEAIFKIPEMLITTFVTEQFVQAVEKSGLTGAKFTRCKIAKSSFFDKFF